jgi:hypothetical protein
LQRGERVQWPPCFHEEAFVEWFTAVFVARDDVRPTSPISPSNISPKPSRLRICFEQLPQAQVNVPLHSKITSPIAAMLSTRLSIIILTFLLAAFSIATAADTPSFPDMTGKGSGSDTSTPSNAPFFDFGPIDETKCHSRPCINGDARQRDLHRHQQVASSSETKAAVGHFRADHWFCIAKESLHCQL